MKVYIAYLKRTLLLMVSVILIVASILYFLGLGEYIGGWIYGGAINLLYLLFLSYQVDLLKDVEVERVARKVQISMVSRLSLVIVLIGIATQIPGISMISLMLGVLSLQIIFYLDYFLSKLLKARGMEQ